MSRIHFGCLIVALSATGWTGCAEGPLHRLGHLNPYVVEKWEAENAYALSLHTKRDNIHQLAKLAAGRDAAKAADAIDQLGQILAEESLPLARIEAARALGRSRRPEALLPLSGAIHDSEIEVRVAVCKSLGELETSEAIAPLQEVIGGDTDTTVRLAAARALGNFREPAAAEALGLALEERSPALQYRAVESLKQITGEDFDGDVERWRQYVKSGVDVDRDGPSLAERLGNWWR